MGFAFIFESVGGTEWFVLLGVVLIVVGPKNLPSAARKLGQMMANLRRAADEFKRQLLSLRTHPRIRLRPAPLRTGRPQKALPPTRAGIPIPREARIPAMRISTTKPRMTTATAGTARTAKRTAGAEAKSRRLSLRLSPRHRRRRTRNCGA